MPDLDLEWAENKVREFIDLLENSKRQFEIDFVGGAGSRRHLGRA